jgi:hypothetical protein
MARNTPRAAQVGYSLHARSGAEQGPHHPPLLGRPDLPWGQDVEIRSTSTAHRGVTWVCESGAYFISGKFDLYECDLYECDLYECEGPLTEARWDQLRAHHQVSGARFYGGSTFAWHLRRAQRVSLGPCARTTEVVWTVYRVPIV